MPSAHIDSPANGSSVVANMPFSVAVSWNAGGSLKEKRPSAAAVAATYSISCSGVAPFETNDPSGVHTFSVMAAASGSMSITAVLSSNGTPLASDPITVSILAPNTPGGFGDPVQPIPHGRKKRLKKSGADKYIYTTYPDGTAAIVCVTYQIVVDQQVPVDGKPRGAAFTVSKRYKKKPRQYSIYKGNLKIDTGRKMWQATVKSDIVAQKKAYQIGVWYLMATGELIFSASVAVFNFAHDTPGV